MSQKIEKIARLLVSQPEPALKEKSPFYDFAQRYKVEIDYRPLIRVEGVELREFRAQKVDVLEHTAVIFTSRMTVDSFFSLCEASRVVIPETMKYICQTEAVALYLQKYIVYRKRKISFGNGTFNGLVEQIVKNRGEKFILTLTEPYKSELPDALEQLGLNVTQAVLARTVPSEMEGVDIESYDLMALYSPADVRALLQRFEVAKVPPIALFGRATLAAAIEAGLTVKAMAPTTVAPSMTKAIEILAEKVRKGEAVADVTLTEDDGSKEEFLKSQKSKLTRKPRAPRAATK
ncbi:MAG: uroporphyrinogen-III synthase [Rikenellaceae bacterium]